MVSRKDLGSWLEGAPSDQSYPGQRMGRPQTGPGSIARPGRRLVAFWIDWLLVQGIFLLLARGPLAGIDSVVLDVSQILVFWAYLVASVGFMGHSLGHLLLGMQVQTLDGRPVGWLTALIRQSLVMFLLPVVLMDADQRGLHDRARNSILIMIR